MKLFTALILMGSLTGASLTQANVLAPKVQIAEAPIQSIQAFEDEFDAQSESSGGPDKYKDIFPKGYAGSYDPINKKRYQYTEIGKTFKTGSLSLAKYDYWRYKTVYSKKNLFERMANLPYHYEACHENNYTLASWSESRTVTVTFDSEVGFEYLGFGASVGLSVSEGVTISTSRNIRATLGMEAKHYPYKASEELEGTTYIQTYTKSTGKVEYLLSTWNDFGLYPYSFFLDNQNVGFIVKREIIKKCDGYENMTKDDNRF